MARKRLTQDDLVKLPKTRDEARVLNSRWFFTGCLCKREHLSARLTSTGSCLDCNRINVLAWKYEHLEEVREADRINANRRYEEDPEFRNKVLKRTVDYYIKNKEKRHKQCKEYRLSKLEELRKRDRDRRQQNLELYRQRYKKYREKRHDKIIISNRIRKAAQKAAKGKFTLEDVTLIREWQSGCCVYCRTPLNGNGTIDHFIAIAKGGTNWPVNIGLACQSCNSKKHDLEVIEFLIRHDYPLSCPYPRYQG